MRFKTIALFLAAAALAAPAALADPGHGKGKPEQASSHGKPPKTGQNCRPRVSVVLAGTLTSDPGANDTSFTMKVLKANRFGRGFLKAGSATINVDAKTKVRRQGSKKLEDLASGDRVVVQARGCKADFANDATPQLTAVRVMAHAPKPASTTSTSSGDDQNGGGDSSTPSSGS